MLSPGKAAVLLAERKVRGVDDPTEAGLDYRWWLDENDHLKGAWWRGHARDFGPVSYHLELKGCPDDS